MPVARRAALAFLPAAIVFAIAVAYGAHSAFIQKEWDIKHDSALSQFLGNLGLAGLAASGILLFSGPAALAVKTNELSWTAIATIASCGALVMAVVFSLLLKSPGPLVSILVLNLLPIAGILVGALLGRAAAN